ncbi:MAG TPA: hypothetical protein VLQ80_02330 [Candidatus Saccharimonadia bacterium]|nr:hypothetical protein [Candidatus Saccharimonadia bacterium]
MKRFISVEDYVATHTLERAQPPAWGARPGFWRSLAHGITPSLTPTPRERHGRHEGACRPFETPMDRLVREHSSLSLLALALI